MQSLGGVLAVHRPGALDLLAGACDLLQKEHSDLEDRSCLEAHDISTVAHYEDLALPPLLLYLRIQTYRLE